MTPARGELAKAPRRQMARACENIEQGMGGTVGGGVYRWSMGRGVGHMMTGSSFFWHLVREHLA